jgi:hypothetical protein
MSVPPLVPSIPTSIQIATPFSYTISNSTTIPAGCNVYSPPQYTLTSGLSTTTLSNVYNTTWNTTITVSQTDTTLTNLSFYSTSYFLGGEGSNGAVIEFELPYVTNPSILDEYNSEISFGDFKIRLIKSSQVSSARYYDVSGPVTSNSNLFSQFNRTVQFTLGTSNISYSFPYYDFVNGGFSNSTGTFSNSTTLFSLIFNNIIFTPVSFPDLTNAPIFSNISNDIIEYKNIEYQCRQTIPTSSPPAYFGVAKFYAPNGYLDSPLWTPVVELLEWDTNVYYVLGDRIEYENKIYKALLDSRSQNPLNPTYWVLSDLNYPQWSDSVTYFKGDRVYYNGSAYQYVLNFIPPINYPPTYGEGFGFIWTLFDATPFIDSSESFTIRSPTIIEPYPEMFPTLSLSNTTSSQIVPFISGNNSLELTFSSEGGFQSVPSNPLQLVINQTIYGVLKQTTTYPISISPVIITTTPTLTSPLSLLTYQPFAYTYSIPDTLLNVGLRYNSNTTSTSLVPYIADGSSIYEMLFSSTSGLTSPGTSRIVIEAMSNGIVVSTSDTSIFTIAAPIISTPSITTGTLSLYKYEAFSYVFTVDPSVVGTSFQVNRSSSELQTFLAVSGDLRSVVFSGSFLISYSSPLNLIVDLLVGSTIISTQTILVSVGPGRFFPPTQNQNFQLYQYENVSNTFGSNIEFLTAAPMTIILSSPSLPSGLTFGGSNNSFFIQGTPNLQVNQSNYQIIGSNSSNGRIVTSIISLRVNPQQIRITPSVSTLTGLKVDIPIDPIITTAIRPDTIYSNTFRYTWSALPDGLNFQNSLGSNISQPFEPLDDSLTITLVGSPSSSFGSLMTSSSGNLFQTRLTATQSNQTGRQTIGTSLFNFSLGETVFVTVSNAVTLYKDKPLGTTDVLITAGSFFAGGSIVESVTADSLPPGLSLVQYISPTVYRLTGTPTEVNLSGTYTFTATNTNGNIGSVVASIPVNPDVVTFGGDTPANGTVLSYIVSQTLTPLVFSATSTSTTIPPTYTASIPFVNYGLVLDSATGILSGTPTASLSSTTVTITATNIFGTIATTTIVVTILPDVFTWPTYTPIYFQNKAITPFEFIVSTLSGRPILSFSSTDLPSGLVINPDGLLLGTPAVGSSGSFTIIASTGYSIYTQVYTYTMIPDQMLIVQVNGTDTITKVFSGVEFRAILYSSDSFVNATFSVSSSPFSSFLPPGATVSVTPEGVLSGDFTNAVIGFEYFFTLISMYGNLYDVNTVVYLKFTSVSGSGTGSVYLYVNDSISFSKPTQTTFTLFEYVPYSIPIELTGSIDPEEYIYYFSSTVPNGFQLIKDTPGLRTAILSGISPTLSTQGIIIYAKTSGAAPTSISLTLRTITPFFVNPQSGAGAYTALLRNDVEGNAAQNARDNRTFPEVNPLAGPLMAPRAPDVVTPNDCILKLCKKPCPTCHTMM